MNPTTDNQMPQKPDESRGYLHPSPRRETTIAPLSHSQPAPAREPSVEEPAPTEQTQVEQVQAEQTAQVQNPQAYDWQQYHTAWQQYYQQYYERYYAQQIHAHRQQLQQQADEAKPDAPAALDHTITGSDASEEPKSRFHQVKDDLLGKVRERADKFRKSNHFMPVLSALIVGSLFLALQYNRSVVAQVESYISPGSTVDVSDTFISDPSANADVGPEPKLLIPKINVNVPVVYDVPTVDDKQVQAGLEKGVVRYNLSGANSLPGQTGNMVVLGHSSNDVFDPGAYKFTFVLLERLQPGDLFYMHYQGKRYVYKVSQKKIIKPTEWKILQQNNGKPNVILVTCTPTGTALNRLLVYGEQISPDPAAAAAPAAAQETNPAEIPGNSPTFFERLWDILF